jgi:hypothetical protein
MTTSRQERPFDFDVRAFVDDFYGGKLTNLCDHMNGLGFNLQRNTVAKWAYRRSMDMGWFLAMLMSTDPRLVERFSQYIVDHDRSNRYLKKNTPGYQDYLARERAKKRRSR